MSSQERLEKSLSQNLDTPTVVKHPPHKQKTQVMHSAQRKLTDSSESKKCSISSDRKTKNKINFQNTTSKFRKDAPVNRMNVSDVIVEESRKIRNLKKLPTKRRLASKKSKVSGKNSKSNIRENFGLMSPKPSTSKRAFINKQMSNPVRIDDFKNDSP